MHEDFSFNLFSGPEKGRFFAAQTLHDQELGPKKMLEVSTPAVSSGMRGRLSVSIHVAGRPRLPPALLSVRLHSSALAQTAGTCGALHPTRSSRAGSGQVNWAATRPC